MTEEEILEAVTKTLDDEYLMNRTDDLATITLARVAINAYKSCFERAGSQWRQLKPNGEWSIWFDGTSNVLKTFEPDVIFEDRALYAMKDKND